QAITNIKWLLEQIVQDLGDSAQWLSSQRPDGFLGAAQLFGTAAVAGTEAMREGLEFVADLANFKGLVDLGTARQFVTDLKWLIEHVAASIGDTAQFLQASRPEGFFAAIKEFSDAVKPGFDILNGALEFMRTVIELDENKFVLDGIGEWIGVFVRVAELVASDL